MMLHARRRTASIAGALAVAILLLTVPGADVAWAKREGKLPAPAHGPRAERNHCITPNGLDLNALFGVSEQIVTYFCTDVETGEQWRPGGLWVVGKTFASVPPGFTSSYPTPLADFVAKLVQVRYVVDPGTNREKSYTFPNSDRLWTGPAGPDADGINTATLGTLHPLPPGEHLVRVFWTFSGTHCDGLGTVPEENCFPPGESLYAPTTFTVAQRRGN
jgi:hypothetical protein